MESEDDFVAASNGLQRPPKFGFKIYENFRNIVRKSSSRSSSNYDFVTSPTYEDVEVTSSHALSSLDSSMTNDSLNNVINKHNNISDGNATDDSGIDSIDQGQSPEPLILNNFKSVFSKESSTWTTKKELVLNNPEAAGCELTSVKKKIEDLETTTTTTTKTTTKTKVQPIYSSVFKTSSSSSKKGNPARDFALTVLENDKKNVVVQSPKTSDLNEISKLLNSTNQLLNRNSNLRASLTISVKRSNRYVSICSKRSRNNLF
jgi:hypothetical protein